MNDYFVHGAPTGPPTIARGGVSRRRTEPLEYREQIGDPEGVTWWMQRVTPSGSRFIKLQPGVRFAHPWLLSVAPSGPKSQPFSWIFEFNKLFTTLPVRAVHELPLQAGMFTLHNQGSARRLAAPWAGRTGLSGRRKRNCVQRRSCNLPHQIASRSRLRKGLPADRTEMRSARMTYTHSCRMRMTASTHSSKASSVEMSRATPWPSISDGRGPLTPSTATTADSVSG